MAAPIVGENSVGHPLGLTVVPRGQRVVGIREDLPLGRAARGCFLLGGLSARSSILRLLKPMAAPV